MAHIGCPIVGDLRYGNKDLDQKLFSQNNALKRLYLHAYCINFMHPLKNKSITLTAPLPEEFTAFMH
jgi:23S rRNA pseudouridine955/2504/2580 synthase